MRRSINRRGAPGVVAGTRYIVGSEGIGRAEKSWYTKYRNINGNIDKINISSILIFRS